MIPDAPPPAMAEQRARAIAVIVYKLPALHDGALLRLSREVEQLPERSLDVATLAAEQQAREADGFLAPEDDRG